MSLRIPRRVAAGLTLALAAAGCGGSGTSHTATSAPPSTTTTSSRTAAPAPRPRPRPMGARVGTTQRVHAGSSTLEVTVTRVLDPLGDSGAALLPGMRAVGVMVAIRDVSGGTYDSTASGDWSVTSTAGKASPLFIRRGVCQTPLVDFESLIGADESRSGCVGFSVRRGARIVAVRFSPHARAPGTATWR